MLPKSKSSNSILPMGRHLGQGDFEPRCEARREPVKAVEQGNHLIRSASVAAWLLGVRI